MRVLNLLAGLRCVSHQASRRVNILFDRRLRNRCLEEFGIFEAVLHAVQSVESIFFFFFFGVHRFYLSSFIDVYSHGLRYRVVGVWYGNWVEGKRILMSDL